MKKNSEIIIVLIAIASYILSTVITGKYLIDYIPKYIFVEFPNPDDYRGSFLPRSVGLTLALILFVVGNFIVNFLSKDQGINIIKFVKKNEKNKKNILFLPLFLMIGLPLIFLFCDFVDVSIGITFNEILPLKSEKLVPFGFLGVLLTYFVIMFFIDRK
mgnify:FL=1|tara:strand:- start:7 stop:483 length:477 start_codon:yes stop_codon:yes gene_type:complete